jgi:hypothetical protein
MAGRKTSALFLLVFLASTAGTAAIWKSNAVRDQIANVFESGRSWIAPLQLSELTIGAAPTR